MTENNYDKLKDAICELVNLAEDATSRDVFEMLDNAGADTIDCLGRLSGFEAIGTIEEFKALKEKNTPMELDEHNFQDEVHHYLCPICRSIVNCTQNYCEECGQALET